EAARRRTTASERPLSCSSRTTYFMRIPSAAERQGSVAEPAVFTPHLDWAQCRPSQPYPIVRPPPFSLNELSLNELRPLCIVICLFRYFLFNVMTTPLLSSNLAGRLPFGGPTQSVSVSPSNL